MKVNNVNVYVNNICNLECVYCYRGEKRKITGKEDNYRIIDDICLKMVREGIENITFTGGEPLLDKYFYKYLEVCNKYKIKVSILTNGTIPINENYLKLINDITFSIDGDEKIMFTQRKVDAHKYRIILSNIKKCIEYNVKIKLNMVITKINLNLFRENIFKFIIDNDLKGEIAYIKINIVESDNPLLKLSEIEIEELSQQILILREMLFYKIPIISNFDLDTYALSLKIDNGLFSVPVWFDLEKNIFFLENQLNNLSLSHICENYDSLCKQIISSKMDKYGMLRLN